MLRQGVGGLPASFTGLLKAAAPATALQFTSLTSMSGGSSVELRWRAGGAATTALAASASSSGTLATSSGAGLVLPSQQLVRHVLVSPVAQQPTQQQQQQQQQPWQPRQQWRPLFNFAGLGSDLSKSYHEKKLMGWAPRQVYDVVAGVEHYAAFVPWCQRSTVLRREPPSYLEAELEVGFQMFVERYTSKVTLHCPTAVHSRVEDSTLFSHLTNKWEFRLGPTPRTCWLTFEVDFAFKSPLYRQVASVFFEEVVQRMMGAFEGRCAHVYGPSSLHRRPGAQPAAAGGR